MAERIYHPPIPYVGRLLKPFNPGKKIKIMGKVPITAYNFNINLQCGPEATPQADIAMQISVRVHHNGIVFNSLENGIWGEPQPVLTCPIKRGNKFEIILTCENNLYKVIFNKAYCFEFIQRMPYERVSHLAIDSGVVDVKIIYKYCFFIEPVVEATTVSPTEATDSTNASLPSYEEAIRSGGMGVPFNQNPASSCAPQTGSDGSASPIRNGLCLILNLFLLSCILSMFIFIICEVLKSISRI